MPLLAWAGVVAVAAAAALASRAQPLEVATMVLAAPLAEEVIFRDLLWRGVQKLTAWSWAPLIVTSALFAAAHATQFGHLPLQDATAWALAFLVMGLLFGGVRRQLGLAAAIAAHACANSVWLLMQ